MQIDSILSLESAYDVFLFDLFGVLWDGRAFYPHALETLKMLRERGKQVAIVTNSPLVRSAAVPCYAERGLDPEIYYDAWMSSGDVARKHLLARDFDAIELPQDPVKCYVIGWPNEDLFEGTGIAVTQDAQSANFVYVGALGVSSRDKKFLDDLMPLLRQFADRHVPMMCINPDRYSASSFGVTTCQPGLVAAAYQEVGGRVQIYGKPHAQIFDDCILRLPQKADKGKMCMTGDTLYTDIAGARNAGIKSILLTQTGITAETLQREPTVTLESLFAKYGVEPTYVVPRV